MREAVVMNDNDRKAAREAFDKWAGENCSPIIQDALIGAWFAALEYLSSQQSQGWISTAERLPTEADGNVLATDGNEIEIYSCFFVREYSGELQRNRLTHWKPLPPIPAPPTTDKP